MIKQFTILNGPRRLEMITSLISETRARASVTFFCSSFGTGTREVVVINSFIRTAVEEEWLLEGYNKDTGRLFKAKYSTRDYRGSLDYLDEVCAVA